MRTAQSLIFAALALLCTAVLTPLASRAQSAATLVAGFDSGVVSVTAVPANASHAAGTSVGGLFAVPVARVADGSGTLKLVMWKSTGASTGTLLIRIWQAKPSNTTCNDNAAFAGNNSDDASLITPPFSLTPAAPASTVGDSASYASVNVSLDYNNSDQTQNLYVCAVTVAIDTADENKTVRLSLAGPQN